MVDATTVAATDVEVIDHEAAATKKFYNIKTKCYFVQTITELTASGKSLCPACAHVGLTPLYYRCWKRLLTKVDNVNATDEFAAYNTKGTAHKLHHGRSSVLSAVRPELKAFMFKIGE
jgi:hypothetical protein